MEAPEEATTPPAPRKRLPRWLLVLTLPYLLLLAAITLVNATGPESFVLSSFNLYLPQWLWMLPGLALLPFYLLAARRWVWLPLLCLLWVAGPLMGMRWRWLAPDPPAAQGTRLRVMTYNVKMGRGDLAAIAKDIEDNKIDVLLCQEANGRFRGFVASYLAGWHTQVSDQFLIATRLPMTNADVKYITYAQWNTQILHCDITVGSQTVAFYTAHLISPRGGLVAMLKNFRHRDPSNAEHLEWNTDTRLGEAHVIAGVIAQDTRPLILTGDLNAPVQSQVCRELFNEGLRDAFDEAGRGYGYSYGQKVRRSPGAYVRIDHIMVSKAWQVLECHAGNTEGSEHRPVIAELFLPNAP